MANAMTPPEAPEVGTAATGGPLPAVSSCAGISVLAKRADFLRAARAQHARMPGMAVQARRRAPGEAEGIRVGFTCSRKVGNAVTRNRAKRRLREVARKLLPVHGLPGWDYVLIGLRDKTIARPFDDLEADLVQALRKLHAS